MIFPPYVLPCAAILYIILRRQVVKDLEVHDDLVNNGELDDDDRNSDTKLYDAADNFLPQKLSYNHKENLQYSLPNYLDSS